MNCSKILSLVFTASLFFVLAISHRQYSPGNQKNTKIPNFVNSRQFAKHRRLFHEILTVDNETMNFASPFANEMGPCEKLLTNFAEVAENFTDCTMANSLPPRFCTRCLENYMALQKAYYDLKDSRETKSLDDIPCSRVIFGLYGTAYADNFYDTMAGDIWTDSRCTDCIEFLVTPDSKTSLEHSDRGYRYNNRTVQFLSLYDKLFDCVDKFGGAYDVEDAAKKNSSVICQECWKLYADLNFFYEDAIMRKWGDFCVDVDSAINDTIRFWRDELKCSLPTLPLKQAEAVFVALISLIFVAMTIIFYSGSFMQGSRRKRRLKKYRSYGATYGSDGLTTINSDIVQDYVEEQHRSMERNFRTTRPEGERSPLLFAGGRRVISYSQLPPSNLG